jgi:hypothetical protein
MPDYPPPHENPNCQCWPNPIAAFFCITGHMTECHYPLSCAQAKCSHLARYDPVDECDPVLDLEASIPTHPATAECPDPECQICSMRDCPYGDPLHYHHDGCPICTRDEIA